MKAGASMRPQKAQVKDKGLGVKTRDFRLNEVKFLKFSPISLGYPLKMRFVLN
jgi:hypothetical protein